MVCFSLTKARRVPRSKFRTRGVRAPQIEPRIIQAAAYSPPPPPSPMRIASRTYARISLCKKSGGQSEPIGSLTADAGDTTGVSARVFGKAGRPGRLSRTSSALCGRISSRPPSSRGAP